MNSSLNRLPIFTLTCVTFTIGILSLLPTESGFQLKEDKLGHLFAYMALSANSLYFSRTRRNLVLFSILVILYGTLLECLQGLIPGREPSFLDIIANSTGVVLGVGIHALIGSKLKNILND
jgi:VanZ family protein